MSVLHHCLTYIQQSLPPTSRLHFSLCFSVSVSLCVCFYLIDWLPLWYPSSACVTSTLSLSLSVSLFSDLIETKKVKKKKEKKKDKIILRVQILLEIVTGNINSQDSDCFILPPASTNCCWYIGLSGLKLCPCWARYTLFNCRPIISRKNSDSLSGCWLDTGK